jgi:DinB superfamily
MLDLLKHVLLSQLEAALAMLNQCITACPPEHWETKIANDTFRQVAYHTLFFTDLYLSPNEAAFLLRDLHTHGGDERGPTLSPGLPQAETLAYLPLIRQKALDIFAAETPDSLQGPSGFSWRKTSRTELHIYNIRHLQHHTGALIASLRKNIPTLQDSKSIPWIGAGWR